jgi:two-component sensor histidine kinase
LAATESDPIGTAPRRWSPLDWLAGLFGRGDRSPRPAHERRTVRHQLALTLALAVAPAGILAVADTVRAYHAAREDAERAYMSDVLLAAQAERDAFVGIRRALEALAVTPAVRGLGGADCHAALGSWVRANPTFALSTVLDADGIVRCSSDQASLGADFGNEERFLAFGNDPRFTVEAVSFGPLTGERVVVAYSPIWEGENLAGALTLSVRTIALEGVGAAGRAQVQPHRMALVDALGTVILEGGDRGTASSATWLPGSLELRPRLGGQPAIFRNAGHDGDSYIVAAAPLVSQRIWLVAAAPADAVYAGILARAAAPVAAPLLMWALAIGVAYLAIDRLVVRHMLSLARLTRAYGRGRLHLRATGTDHAPREIALLGEDLSLMAERLDTRERALRRTAEANRVLILEVYHRVKNNLQMIVSLLSLQRRRASTTAERDAIERIESRVHSLSLVHQTLYASEDVHHVRLDILYGEIIASLEGLRPEVAIHATLDPVEETPERATPLALLLNEAMTNAIKYAASATGAPRIEARLIARAPDDYRLEVINDAADMPDQRPSAIGGRLMAGFAKQLRGQLTAGRVGHRFVLRLTVAPDLGATSHENRVA